MPANYFSPGVVILAAGASSRMGRPKLLLPWDATSIIGHLIQQWQKLNASQIAIVARPDDAKLKAELDRLNFSKENRIINPQPENGMFSSIQCAANWPGWKNEINIWAIVLGDQPHLQSDTLKTLLAFSREHPGEICQPEFDGHGGHPVFLPRMAFAELKHPAAKNLKDFLKTCRVRRCPINDAGLMSDLDTPADYQRQQGLLRQAKNAGGAVSFAD